MNGAAQGPVFVVGPSRSGTTFVAACLNTSPDLHVGAETHYFDDLRVRMRGREQAQLKPEEARACESYFMALAHGAYGNEAARRWTEEDDTPSARVDRRALHAEVELLGAGSDAWFEAFCRLQAKAAGKPRWGEKTPRHVFRIGEILTRWPEARVLCMVRDPRAVVASYRAFSRAAHREARARAKDAVAWAEGDRVRIARSHHPALLALLWRGAARASLAAALRDPRVRLLRYEDLVAAPDATLCEVAAWMDIRLDPAALARVPRMNSSFAERSAHTGASADSLERWREVLDDRALAVVQRLCRGAMNPLGYEPIPVRRAFLHVTLACAELPLAALRAVRANRARIAGLPSYLARRLAPGFRRD